MGRLLVLAMLIGCNQAFGIDQTISARPDASVCWDPAQTTHDEDGDGIKDGCDLCPGYPDPTQPDEDGDGVGDECDPNLLDARDHLKYFDGFAVGPLDSQWRAYGNAGTWTNADGAAAQTADRGRGALVLDRVFANSSAYITLGGQQVPIDPDDGTSAGVIVRIPVGTANASPVGTLCHAYHSLIYGRLIILEDQPDPGTKKSAMFPEGALARLRVTSRGLCLGRRDELAAISLLYDNFLPIEPAHQIGLYTYNTTARFESITVIETDL